jgi:hypothetical protein
MVHTQELPDYPEFADVAEEARRRSSGPVNPADVRNGGLYDQIESRRGDDWCSIITGQRPWPGWQRMSHNDCARLAVADERDIDPPAPAWMVQARAERDQARRDRTARDAALEERRRELRDRDMLAWDGARAAATAAGVELEVYQNPTARARHGFGHHLGHAVPAAAVYSGSRRVRTHQAGRALCETETRPRPLRLEDRPSPESPVTCVSCLAWAAKVRTTP